MFKVTEKWIMDNRTPRGGWKASQLWQIGVKWPPQSGWKRKAAGRIISDQAKAKFEAYAAPKDVQSDLFLDCLDNWSGENGLGRKTKHPKASG